MKKTNIRIDNVFIIKEKGKYFMSNISDPDEWVSIDDSTINKKKEVTGKLLTLLDDNNLSSNVNFCGFDMAGG